MPGSRVCSLRLKTTNCPYSRNRKGSLYIQRPFFYLQIAKGYSFYPITGLICYHRDRRFRTRKTEHNESEKTPAAVEENRPWILLRIFSKDQPAKFWFWLESPLY